MKSRIDLDSAGKRHTDPVLGANPLGILCFSRFHFAAQYMRRDRTEVRDASQGFRGANVSSVFNGFDGHFGTYILDEASATLIVRLEGAISPSDIGREFKRSVGVQGDELVIHFATTSADGSQVRRTLTFSRLM